MSHLPADDDPNDPIWGEGGSNVRFLRRPGDATEPSAIEVLTPAQIGDEQARPYVVKGLVARGDHVISMGQPSSGKSVIAPHVAYAVAQGRQVFGRRVKAGPVLYLASEDGHGMKNRVRALRKRHGEAPDFHLVPTAVNLLTSQSQFTAVKALVERLRPALIVIDTLSRSFPGLRENEGEDMGHVVGAVRELSAVCDSAVWSIHHVAKDAGTTPRGHGSLAADADITLLVEGAGREARSIRLGKNRNGASDIALAFSIDVEDLGRDEDDDPITAPVAVEVDPEGAKPNHEARLADRPATLLRTLRNLDPHLVEEVRPEAGMPLCKAVRRSKLRGALVDQGWFPEGEILPALSAALGGSKLTKAGYVIENNALTPLKRKGLINFNREWIWLL